MRRPCVFPATACACAAQPRPQIGAEEKWYKCRCRYQSIARRRAHDSQLQRCRIALPNTRVRRRRHRRSRRWKFPAEYPLQRRRCPNTISPRDDGRFTGRPPGTAVTGGSGRQCGGEKEGDDTRSYSGPLNIVPFSILST